MSRNYEWWERGPNDPIYYGEGDVEGYLEWELRMDQLFGSCSYSSSEKVAKAVCLLKGKAYAKWKEDEASRRMKGYKPITTWGMLKHELRRRYVPLGHYVILRRRFRKLVQGSNSVEEYYWKHRQLQHLLGIDYPEWERMEHFVDGLNDETYRMAQGRRHHSPGELVRYITEASLDGVRMDTSKVAPPTPQPLYDPGMSITPNRVPSLPETPQFKNELGKSNGDLITCRAEPLVEEKNDVPRIPESPPKHAHDSPVQIPTRVDTDEWRPLPAPMKVNHHVVSLEDAPTMVSSYQLIVSTTHQVSGSENNQSSEYGSLFPEDTEAWVTPFQVPSAENGVKVETSIVIVSTSVATTVIMATPYPPNTNPSSRPRYLETPFDPGIARTTINVL